MEDRWQNKNIQLPILSDYIGQFFKQSGFSVSLNGFNGDYRITAQPKSDHSIAEDVHVSLSGNPNDFTVKFIAGSRSRMLVRSGTILQLFGGGFLSLKGIKSQEALEKLERKFWIYVTEKVSQLVCSERETP
ncbi:MAG: hypothetical protein OEX01_04385 [Candidatus Bathyarchaeota archaeon]|nr:hypothetical protein [Candidatus Bathyarchaeota archaeon]